MSSSAMLRGHGRSSPVLPILIAIELAVAGALLWQVRFFESSSTAQHREHLPDARLRLLLALVLGATLFGSLWAMANEGNSLAAISVTVGLAVSVFRSCSACYPHSPGTLRRKSAFRTTSSPWSGYFCTSPSSPAWSCS
jgi:hypothetical protein